MDDRPARPNRLLFRNLITQIQSVSHQPISGTKIHLERLGGRKDGVGKIPKMAHAAQLCARSRSGAGGVRNVPRNPLAQR
jgi:hypothetical protein